MKLKAAAAALLIGLIAGCQQQPPSAVQNTAYEWEKAYMNGDYDREQELLYEKGTFEVHKTMKKQQSGLKKDDIRYEIYYDKDFKRYLVLTKYKNPMLGNTVNDKLVIRKKGNSWKVDADAVFEYSTEDIRNKFDRQACINCK